MLCPVCQKNNAIKHSLYGYLPCKKCTNRRKKNTLPDRPVEMAGRDVQGQRREYAKSIIQPWRGGVLSKEYLDLYGTKNIKPTAKEIRGAKRVWSDIHSANFNLKKTK